MCLNSNNPESLPRNLTEAEYAQLYSSQSYYFIRWSQGVAFLPICKADISKTRLPSGISSIMWKRAVQGNGMSWCSPDLTGVGHLLPSLRFLFYLSKATAFPLIRQRCQGNERIEIKEEKNFPIILLFQCWECILKQHHIFQLQRQLWTLSAQFNVFFSPGRMKKALLMWDVLISVFIFFRGGDI